MSSFLDTSKQIVKDFLQTVVILDDELYFSSATRTVNSAHVDENNLPEPTTQQVVQMGRATHAFNTPASTSDAEESNNSSHDVNIAILADTFSQNGILCSFIKPSINDNIKEKYTPILKKADLLILDWKLQAEDYGQSAKTLIETIIKDEPDTYKNSTRYIAIYSGEDNLSDKLDEVMTILVTNLGLTVTKNESLCILKSGHLIIRFFAKPSQRGRINPAIIVDESTLVNTIIDDFTSTYAGLVSNMALKATTVLRKNIHRILTTLSKDLDEAYLSHRALLPESKDAEEFMVDILISELHSILIDSSEIKDTLNIDHIMKWFDCNFNDEKYKRLFLNTCFINNTEPHKHDKLKEHFALDPAINLNRLEAFNQVFPNKLHEHLAVVKKLTKKIFEENIEKTSCIILKQKKEKIEKDPFTQYLYQDTEKWQDSEVKLAALSIMKNKYTFPKPYMTLGTVVKDKNDNFFICMIPRCDAARVELNERKYPFLKLVPFDKEKQAKFEIVIKDGDIYKKFIINYKSYELSMLHLKKYARDQNAIYCPIYANKNAKNYTFKQSSNEFLYWIGELKSEKAQSIANRFASELSRVGFNESEYLRRAY